MYDWDDKLWRRERSLKLGKEDPGPVLGAPPYEPYFPSYFSKEETEIRRYYYREYRNKARHLVRTGRWDDILPFKKTRGWLTW